MEVILESLKRKVALSKCKERKWSTRRFSTAIMPCNLAERGRWKGRLKKKGMQNAGVMQRRKADIKGERVWEVVVGSSLGEFSSSVELLACLFSTTRLRWPNLGLGFWNPTRSQSLPKTLSSFSYGSLLSSLVQFCNYMRVCASTKMRKILRKKKKTLHAPAWGYFKETLAFSLMILSSL